MARYEAGETLASIARTYDCSPPAISYVVSRSRARQPSNETATTAAEPKLIKGDETAAGHGNASPVESLPIARESAIAAAEPAIASPVSEASSVRHATAASPVEQQRQGEPRPEFRLEANEGQRAAPGRRDSLSPAMPPRPQPAAPPRPLSPAMGGAANGEQRRTLHLSLGGPASNGGTGHPSQQAHGNGGDGPGQYAGRAQPPAGPFPASAGPLPSAMQDRPMQDRPYGAPPRPATDRYGAAELGINMQPGMPNGAAGSRDPARDLGEPGQRKESRGSFIDTELRARVDGDIAAFLAAFDAALVQDTIESRAGLREATDRLLRAGARTRIELERLEARIPLPPRDGPVRSEPAWRSR